MTRFSQNYPPQDGSPLFEAWCRARRRSMCQDMGLDADDPRSAGVEFVARPHEVLPYVMLEAISLGRKLARRYGW